MDRPAPANPVTAKPGLAGPLLACRDALLAFVLTLTRDADVAEEVVQEVSLTVVQEASHGFAPEDFFAWVLTLARHRVADHYRALTRDRRLLEKLSKLADAASDAFLHHRPQELDDHRLQLLRQCLDRLRGRAKRLIDARYVRSLSVPEIAAELSWKSNSVSVALSRLRATLADCMRRKLAAEADHV